MNGSESNSLKAKIEQTRIAREAFLRGTVSSSNSPPPIQLTSSSITTIASTSTATSATSAPKSNIMPSDQKTSVASIVRDNYSNSTNREITTDKASFLASLNSHIANNLTNGNANGGNHLYQNVQPLKAPINNESNAQKKTLVNNTNNINGNGIAHTNTNGHSNGHHSNENDDHNKSKNNGVNSLSLSSSNKVKTLEGYVGFANLPNQVYRKSVKKGFEFNLMVIGESGLGKSTFINSLFLTELYNPSDFPGTFERRKKTTFVDTSTVLLSEKGVNLRLSVIDTPGFGESIDNSNCWIPIIDYIDSKYEEYLNAESKVNRKLPIPDHRVHCCLHFISPGHTLKQLDIEVMKKLHDRVNLIPVIAKADTMTPDEVKQFKATVLNVITEQKLQIYEFPDIDDDDVDTNRTNNTFKSKLPFAIVGSNKTIDIDGKSFRGRQYPWGTVNIDELGHCDFMALRTMLIRTHMQELKDITNDVHYENYRFKKLAHVTGDKAKPNNKNPFQQLEEEKREAELRLEKMKNEMEGVFDLKVREKITRLKESEMNLEKQQEAMKLSLEKEERDLEERRLQFLKEKQLWEESNREDEEKIKYTLDKEADKKKKKIF